MYSTVPTGEMADSCRMLMVRPKSPCSKGGGQQSSKAGQQAGRAAGRVHASLSRWPPAPSALTSLTRPESSMKMFSSLMSLQQHEGKITDWWAGGHVGPWWASMRGGT